jgi:Phage integrase SAM-like domain
MASISQLQRNGKIIGFQTNLGRGPDGKAQRKFHKTYVEAQKFIEAAESDRIGTGELYKKKAELVFALQKLQAVNATISEAVDFFLMHGAKREGNPTIGEVMREFIADKREVGRRENYLEALRDKWNHFTSRLGQGANTKLAEITANTIKHYVFAVQRELSNTTKSDYLRSLSILFNYGIKKRYTSINPVMMVERPRVEFHPPEVLSPEDFSSLLHRCLKRQWYDRLTIFVLSTRSSYGKRSIYRPVSSVVYT